MAPIRHVFRRRLSVLTAVLALLSLAVPVFAQATLHEQIDAALAQVATGPASPPVSDHEYVRRIYLDLTGVPPTLDQTRTFVADPNPAKRTAIVDQLLAGPAFPRHMAQVFDVLLMERRANTHIPQDDWHAYLFESFKTNKPLHLLAREILSADGATPALRAAARFYLDRKGEPNLLTRDVSRIFFGRDLQCAQCHDHPLIDDYHQLDYQSLLACLNPGVLVTIKEGDKSVAYYGEQAGQEFQYESVFIKGTKHLARPRLVLGPAIADPVFPVGEEYTVRPADNVRPVPKFSLRQQLANLATDGTYRPFNENMANRLWAHMMGRGLVQPVDLHHSDNPPLHPELMKQLGERLAAMNFDTRAFLRELALTQVYQRSLDVTADLLAASTAMAPKVAELESTVQAAKAAESAADAAYEKALAERDAAEAALLPVANERDQAKAKAKESLKKFDAAQKAMQDAQAQVTVKQEVLQSITDAVAKTKEVIAKLPRDQELINANQIFLNRLAQVTAELPPLQKAVEEKTAAMQAPAAELTTERTAVAAVDTRLAPSLQDLSAKEVTLFAARQQQIAAATSAAALERQLGTMKSLAGMKPKGDQAVALAQSIPQKEAEVLAAQKAADEYAPTVAQRQKEVQGADQIVTTSGQALAAVQAEQQKQTEIASAVALAATQAEAARAKLSQDPVLTEAAQKLKARSDELQQGLAAIQTQVQTAQTALAKAQEQKTAAEAALKGANDEMAKRQQTIAAAQGAVAAAKAEADQAQAGLVALRNELVDRWSSDLTAAPLKPLSPEQLCWSILQVTGVYDRYWKTEEAELAKTAPMTPEAQQDPAQVQARQIAIEQRTWDKLKGTVGSFVAVYGAAAGQPQGDFFATVDQALFAANAGVVTSWVAPAGGNVTERMMNQADPAQAASDLYLTLLTRNPTPEEIQDVTNYLTPRAADKAVAVQELAWAILTSAEFRFGH